MNKTGKIDTKETSDGFQREVGRKTKNLNYKNLKPESIIGPPSESRRVNFLQRVELGFQGNNRRLIFTR
jgi:hypothetical protein